MVGGLPGAAHLRRAGAVFPGGVNGGGDLHGGPGSHHPAGLFVLDKLQRAAAVAAGDYRLGGEHSFQGDVAVILIEGAEEDRQRVGVPGEFFRFRKAPDQFDRLLQAVLLDQVMVALALTALPGNDDARRAFQVAGGFDQQILAFEAFQTAGAEHVAPLLFTAEVFGAKRRVIQRRSF